MLKKLFKFLFCLFFFKVSVIANTLIEVDLIKVIDGDSLKVKVNNQQIELRLWGIDAPEYQQPMGRKAKKVLKSLCQNKKLFIEKLGRDHYKRTLAVLYSDQENLNEQMLIKGYAWVYPKKQKYYQRYKYLENLAKHQGDGLWMSENAMTPWKFRRFNKK